MFQRMLTLIIGLNLSILNTDRGHRSLTTYVCNSRHPRRRGTRSISVEVAQRRVQDKHGDQVVLCAETYVNPHTKAMFIDRDYGSWWTQPGSVFLGTSHPLRTPEKIRDKIAYSRDEIVNKLLPFMATPL